MLHINNLTYHIEGRALFENASATIPKGAKVGLVGRNGVGKSTLFRLIQNEIDPLTGDISIIAQTRLGAVAQEAPNGHISLLETVLQANKEMSALQQEAKSATDPSHIAHIHTRLADLHAHTAQSRASALLRGLGFTHEDIQAPCAQFSGGWRMRVALAAMLFVEPDLLLLDEPTNYLDLEGSLWLQAHLRRYPHSLIIISHDKDILNKVATSILHIDQQKLHIYKGHYDSFETNRRAQIEHQQKSAQKQQKEAAHLQAFVDRFRAKATKAKQAQSRLKALEKLKPIQIMFDQRVMPFHFQQPKKAISAPMIRLQNASVGYDGTAVLTKLDLRLDPNDRIALIGRNGNGKSSFAKLLAGKLKQMTGTLECAKKLSIAYVAQHQLDALNGNLTPYEAVRDRHDYDTTEAKTRARVAQMGLCASRTDVKIKNLCGGEKARLMLGLASFDGPNFLILDEPTNHLDIDSRTALIHALNHYEGAVLVISHDRHLIDATMDQIWIAQGGTVKPYEGDLDSYEAMLTAPKETNTSQGKDKSNKPATQKKRDRQERAQQRLALAPLAKKIKAHEKQIEKLQTKLVKLDEQLGNPDLYTNHSVKAADLTKQRGQLAKQLQAVEKGWLELSQEYEEKRVD